jgi:hypothetical protein
MSPFPLSETKVSYVCVCMYKTAAGKYLIKFPQICTVTNSYKEGRREREREKVRERERVFFLPLQICDVDNDGLLNDQELNDFQVRGTSCVIS